MASTGKIIIEVVIAGAALYALSKIAAANVPSWQPLSINDFNLWNDGHCTQCQPILGTNNDVLIPFPPNNNTNCCPPYGVCGGDYPKGSADTCPSTGIGNYIQNTNGFKVNAIFKCNKITSICTDQYSQCGEMNVALSYWNDPCHPLEYGFLTWPGTANPASSYGYIMAYLQGPSNNFWQSPKIADYDGLEHEYKAIINPNDGHQIDYYIDNIYKLSIRNPYDSYANQKMKYIYSVHRWDCNFDSTNWSLNIRNPIIYR